MTQEQEINIGYIISALNKYGIKNTYMQAGILSTVAKETDFIPRSESLYYSTPKGLLTTYPSYFPTIDSASSYIKNSEAVANKVYGGRYGNTEPGDGYKFRGRGYNQITFKSAYEKFGHIIGVDLVNNPDLLNDPKIAAEALAAYFSDLLKQGEKSGVIKKKFGVDSISKVNDTTTATKIAVQANAGWANSVDNYVEKKALDTALSRVSSLYNYTLGKVQNVGSESKRHPLAVPLILVAVVGFIYVGLNKNRFF